MINFSCLSLLLSGYFSCRDGHLVAEDGCLLSIVISSGALGHLVSCVDFVRHGVLISCHRGVRLSIWMWSLSTLSKMIHLDKAILASNVGFHTLLNRGLSHDIPNEFFAFSNGALFSLCPC